MTTPARCLTGAETTTRELEIRLRRDAELHEVRLDLLQDVGDDTFALLRHHGGRLVVACRATVEGGGFVGTEGQRLAVLARAARSRIAWLDLELLLFEQGATARLDLDRIDQPPRLVASLHDFDGGPGRAEQLARRFEGCPADVAKLAVAVHDVDELAVLRRVELHCPRRVVIGMGDTGVWSRMRPADFRSAWTYLAASEELATAPGQVSAVRSRTLRLDDHVRLAPLALLGGSAIRRSPGPTVYGALLRDLDAPYQYLPLPSTAAPSRAGLDALGVHGMSVAAPFKASMAAHCEGLDRWAQRCSAVNTIQRLEDGRWFGSNTDAPAARALLGDHLGTGDRVVILGTGATARAIGAALAELGCSIVLAGRRGQNVDTAHGSIRTMAEAGALHPDVLVNCIPVGGDDDTDPWPGELGARVVLDLVLPAVGPTPLVARARDAGCHVITGRQLWCHQGARQMSLLLNTTITPEQIEGYLTTGEGEI